jgi:predicted site-specific integrase-resolvase
MYSAGKFAKMINHHVRTLQRWDNLGILKPANYSPGGRKLYSHEQYLNYINQPIISEEQKKSVIYCRVSSFNQKSDLNSQVKFVEQYCTDNQIHVDELYSDIGSGLNYKRKNLVKLINNITRGEVDKVIIAHKDRLVRFGFEIIEELCKENGVELIIINEEKLSPQEEMVTDLMSIIHVFSSRLYGLRTYKNKIKDIIETKSNESLKEN